MATIEYDNIFDAITDNPQEAQELQTRADLISAICDRVQDGSWRLAKAAEKVGLNQSEMRDLLDGKVIQFSVEKLMTCFRLLRCR
jgi:predicted XRE-type DNA-binding protein